MHVMTFEPPLNNVGGLASEASTAAQTVSSGNNSPSPVDVSSLDQQPKQEDATTAVSETADASGSGRSLKLRQVFSRSRNNNTSGSSRRGSFVRSFRSSIRSSFASSFNLSDDSLEAEQHGVDDLTQPGQQRSSGRRRSSLLKKTFSTSRRSSAFNSRSSVESSGTGRSKRSSAVNRKSSLDLIRGSGGEYRPRAEHPLLTDNPPTEDKSKRRGSFLGVAMRKLSMGGSASNSFTSSGTRRAQLNRSKSSSALASAASSSVSPLSSSDHGPLAQQRKGSFFGSFRKASSVTHIVSKDDDPTQGLSTSIHC